MIETLEAAPIVLRGESLRLLGYTPLYERTYGCDEGRMVTFRAVWQGDSGREYVYDYDERGIREWHGWVLGERPR